MPVTVLRPSLHELEDILEQIFRIACTENLHPRPEEYDAAANDCAAAHGLSLTAMRERMRHYGTLSEIHERAQVIALMRLYANRLPQDQAAGSRSLFFRRYSRSKSSSLQCPASRSRQKSWRVASGKS